MAWLGYEAGSNACGEQGGCRVIVQAGGSACNLMEPSPVEAMVSEAIVDRCETERERRPPRHLGTGKLGAQSGELIGR